MWNKVSFLKSYLPCASAKNRLRITFTIYYFPIFLSPAIMTYQTAQNFPFGWTVCVCVCRLSLCLLLSLSFTSRRYHIVNPPSTVPPIHRMRSMYSTFAFESFIFFHMEVKSLGRLKMKQNQNRIKIKTHVWTHKFSYIHASTVQLRYFKKSNRFLSIWKDMSPNDLRQQATAATAQHKYMIPYGTKNAVCTRRMMQFMCRRSLISY